MLNAPVLERLSNCVLIWLATVDTDGMPSVSPKEIFAPEGDKTLLIANVASAGSVKNIRQERRVCVSFVDVFVQRGYKLYGQAQILETNAPDYATRAEPLLKIAGEKFPIRSVMVVALERVVPIVAPRYALYAETTQAAQVGRAVARYNRVLENFGVGLEEKNTVL
jgi:uncharacterized protein